MARTGKSQWPFSDQEYTLPPDRLLIDIPLALPEPCANHLLSKGTKEYDGADLECGDAQNSKESNI